MVGCMAQLFHNVEHLLAVVAAAARLLGFRHLGSEELLVQQKLLSKR